MGNSGVLCGGVSVHSGLPGDTGAETPATGAGCNVAGASAGE